MKKYLVGKFYCYEEFAEFINSASKRRRYGVVLCIECRRWAVVRPPYKSVKLEVLKDFHASAEDCDNPHVTWYGEVKDKEFRDFELWEIYADD